MLRMSDVVKYLDGLRHKTISLKAYQMLLHCMELYYMMNKNFITLENDHSIFSNVMWCTVETHSSHDRVTKCFHGQRQLLQLATR